MGKLSWCWWFGKIRCENTNIRNTLICVKVEWTTGGIPQNQQTEPEEETQGGAHDLPGKASDQKIYCHRLIFMFHFSCFIVFDGLTCSCPGAGPSQGSGDGLWYTWGWQGSRLELHHLAGGAEPERGRGCCCVGRCWSASRITAAPFRYGGITSLVRGTRYGVWKVNESNSKHRKMLCQKWIIVN